MPFLPALAAIASIAGAGTSIGLGIANAVGGPSQPPQPTTAPQPTAAQNVAAEVDKRRQEGALVANQDPNIVANTNGSLSGLSDQTFASQSAGLPGTFGEGGIDLNSIMQFLGGSNSGAPTNLLSLATGPSITG